MSDYATKSLIVYKVAFQRSFGKKLRKSRKESGLTQQNLSEKIGMSRPSLINIERGEKSLSLFQLKTLSNVLQVDSKDLLPSDREIEESIEELRINTSSPLLGKALIDKGFAVKEEDSSLNKVLAEFGVNGKTKEEENHVP